MQWHWYNPLKHCMGKHYNFPLKGPKPLNMVERTGVSTYFWPCTTFCTFQKHLNQTTEEVTFMVQSYLAKRTTFIFTVGEVDRQPSGREERQRRTDFCSAARANIRIIMHTCLSQTIKTSEKQKNFRACRTSCTVITVRVLRGKSPAMRNDCRSTNGADKALKYLLLPFLFFLLMGGGMRVHTSLWLSPPSPSPCSSYSSESSSLSGQSTGKPILQVHKQKQTQYSFDLEQMQKGYVRVQTKTQITSFHF